MREPVVHALLLLATLANLLSIVLYREGEAGPRLSRRVLLLALAALAFGVALGIRLAPHLGTSP